MQVITFFKVFINFFLSDKNHKMFLDEFERKLENTCGNVKSQSPSKQNVKGRAKVELSLLCPCLIDDCLLDYEAA